MTFLIKTNFRNTLKRSYASWIYRTYVANTPLKKAKVFAKRVVNRLAYTQRVDDDLLSDSLTLERLIKKRDEYLDKDFFSNKVIHFIGSLQSGGAERQLCNCAIAQKKAGLDVVVLLFQLGGEHSHYEYLLRNEGIPIRLVGESYSHISFLKSLPKHIPLISEIACSVPQAFFEHTFNIFKELMDQKPAVFHSWLDGCNIPGGVAAIIAGTPRIILSTRNVNPDNFPRFNQPYFKNIYKALLTSKRVGVINNSYAGAISYANWLEIDISRIKVVHNGISFNNIAKQTEDLINDFRKGLNIPKNIKIISGVFRLADEKRPLFFLEVIFNVLRTNLDVTVIIAGTGPYEQLMKEAIVNSGYEDRIILLGQRSDISLIFSASWLTLLCSSHEGTPNVLLESQWLGCPVVAADVGGVAESMMDGKTGFLIQPNDLCGFISSVNLLVNDSDIREEMSRAGPKFIAENFGLERMSKETIAFY